MAVVPAPAYDEVNEFLLSSPTPEDVIAFRPSESTQKRIRALLDANRVGRLSDHSSASWTNLPRLSTWYAC